MQLLMASASTYTIEQGKTTLLSDSVHYFNKEVFGVGCGDGFAGILKRFHAINVLECGADLSTDEIKCLESKIHSGC